MPLTADKTDKYLKTKAWFKGQMHSCHSKVIQNKVKIYSRKLYTFHYSIDILLINSADKLQKLP